MKNAIAKNPKFKFSYTDLISISISSGHIDEAEKIIKDYVGLGPNSSHPYLIAGLFYAETGKLNEALKYLKQAISGDKLISVSNEGLYFYASNVFLKVKMFNEAKQALNIVLSFNPFNKEAKENLSLIQK